MGEGWMGEGWMGEGGVGGGGRKEGRKKKHIVNLLLDFHSSNATRSFDQANFVCLKTQNHVLWVQITQKDFQVSAL